MEGRRGGDRGEGGSRGRGPPCRRGVSTLTYDAWQEVSRNSSGEEDKPIWAEACRLAAVMTSSEG